MITAIKAAARTTNRSRGKRQGGSALPGANADLSDLETPPTSNLQRFSPQRPACVRLDFILHFSFQLKMSIVPRPVRIDFEERVAGRAGLWDEREDALSTVVTSRTTEAESIL